MQLRRTQFIVDDPQFMIDRMDRYQRYDTYDAYERLYNGTNYLYFYKELFTFQNMINFAIFITLLLIIIIFKISLRIV